VSELFLALKVLSLTEEAGKKAGGYLRKLTEPAEYLKQISEYSGISFEECSKEWKIWKN